MSLDSTINQLGNVLTYIVISVIVVAIIGVVVSQKSQSAALVQSFGSAFDGALSIAEAPITNNQGSAATGAGTTGGTTNNTVIGSQLSNGLLRPLTTPLPTLGQVVPLGLGGIGAA
jgi:hypothetical protein